MIKRSMNGHINLKKFSKHIFLKRRWDSGKQDIIQFSPIYVGKLKIKISFKLK